MRLLDKDVFGPCPARYAEAYPRNVQFIHEHIKTRVVFIIDGNHDSASLIVLSWKSTVHDVLTVISAIMVRRSIELSVMMRCPPKGDQSTLALTATPAFNRRFMIASRTMTRDEGEPWINHLAWPCESVAEHRHMWELALVLRHSLPLPYGGLRPGSEPVTSPIVVDVDLVFDGLVRVQISDDHAKYRHLFECRPPVPMDDVLTPLRIWVETEPTGAPILVMRFGDPVWVCLPCHGRFSGNVYMTVVSVTSGDVIVSGVRLNKVHMLSRAPASADRPVAVNNSFYRKHQVYSQRWDRHATVIRLATMATPVSPVLPSKGDNCDYPCEHARWCVPLKRRDLRRRVAVATIERAWIRCLADPGHAVCRRRLMREFGEMIE